MAARQPDWRRCTLRRRLRSAPLDVRAAQRAAAAQRRWLRYPKPLSHFCRLAGALTPCTRAGFAFILYMRRVVVLVALLLLPLAAIAVSVPSDWRLPNAGDRIGEWVETDPPFHIHGDFDGNGFLDEAWILFRTDSNTWAVFVFLQATDGTERRFKLDEERNVPAQRFVLETIRPSKIVFRTACGKGYVKCAKGEPSTIQFHLPSISLCRRESSCLVYVWQRRSARFQPIRMSD